MAEPKDKLRKDIGEYKAKIDSVIDKAIANLLPIKETFGRNAEQENEADEELDNLQKERDQLLEESNLFQSIVDLQLKTISVLNRQHGHLLKTLGKYKQKAATQLETVANLGKRTDRSSSISRRDFNGQTARQTVDVGVQCFEYLNEHEDYTSNVQREEMDYVNKIEECFRLLLIARYGAGGLMAGRKKPQSHQNSHAKEKTAQRLDLNSDSGVEDEGSMVFDGNLSPNVSERDPLELQQSGKDKQKVSKHN